MRALAEAGEPEGTWLRADRQTGGRGRRGRAWVSPEGNLHASTLVRLREGDPPASTLALVAAVALHDVTSLALNQPSPSLGMGTPVLLIKWPNDLLLDGKKLAGILLERAEDAVIIGFGVNLAHAPEGLDRPSISVSAWTGSAPPQDVILQMLAEGFARRLIGWRNEGLAPISASWIAAAHPIGTVLSTPEGDGLFEGLDEAGALRLRLTDGAIRLIRAGDVFLV